MLARLASSGTQLSAGETLAVTGSGGEGAVKPWVVARNFYASLAGTTLDLGGLAGLFFDTPSSRVSAAGGADVGAFAVEMSPAPPLTWTNHDDLASVVRGQAADVVWTGGAADGLVAVVGVGHDPLSQSAGGFLCVERAASGSLSVPGWATAYVPRGGTAEEPAGLMTLISLPGEASPFTATGLDFGFGVFASMEAIDVDFQ
jgi:hypothetical protein